MRSQFLLPLAKDWPLEVDRKFMSSCIFFQIIIRPLKIFPWTCILHFPWDELKFYPTFEKKHNNLIFSKLGYSKISSRGYTQRMLNTSPEAIAQRWKKSKFCGYWDFLFLKRHSGQDKCCFNNATCNQLFKVGENCSLKKFAKDFILAQKKFVHSRRRQRWQNRSNIICSMTDKNYCLLFLENVQ